jgi:spermidine synthase
MKLADQLDTKYYTADIHHASFALPAFVRQVCKCIIYM